MLKLATFVCLAAFASSAQANNLIVNGSFENPILQGEFVTYQGPSQANSVTGWYIDTGGVSVHSSSLMDTPAYDGNQYLDLVGYDADYPNGIGSIEQSFATVAGQSYILNFAYSHVVFGVPAAAASFTVGDLSDSVSHNTGYAGTPDWRTYQHAFTATNNVTTLRFENTLGNESAGLTIDAVSVTPAPEPAEWAMMVAGLGLVGTIARRRHPREGGDLPIK